MKKGACGMRILKNKNKLDTISKNKIININKDMEL